MSIRVSNLTRIYWYCNGCYEVKCSHPDAIHLECLCGGEFTLLGRFSSIKQARGMLKDLMDIYTNALSLEP